MPEVDSETTLREAATGRTPLYVYDLGALAERVSTIRAAFSSPSFELFFATMANDQEAFLRALAALGVGGCVNSRLHLDLAETAGIARERIQFTSTGISVADLEVLHERGIGVNLDSLEQVRSWVRLGGTSFGLRVNSAALRGLDSGDRIGMSLSDVEEAVAFATSQRASVDGVHVYVGTNFLNHAEMLPVLTALYDVAKGLPAVKYVNVGGGVGVSYSKNDDAFDLCSFGAAVCSLHEELERVQQRRVRLIFEPGRSVAARAGVFVTTVSDVKTLHGTRYVCVDGSVALFPRPLLHSDARHRVRLLRLTQSPMSPATVVGRTTFSRDILAIDELPVDLRVGDLLAIEDAGAYCQSMTSRFLGQGTAHAVYVPRA